MAGLVPPNVVAAQPAPVLQPPVAAPGVQMPAAPKPRTFRDFYADSSRDPCKGDYQRIMQRFDPEAATIIASDVLLEQALGNRPDLHQAYLCCAATRRGPRVFCIHLPSRFTSALDGRVTPWDNNLYASLREVTQDIATTVCFPTNAFVPTANVLAFTEEYIQANLQGLNGLEVFPAATVANNHTTPVTTRYLMYLPSRYVHLFLDSSGYTIKHIWQVLPPLLNQHQDTAHCQDLLK
jgi:hypothetical protein